jgi:hypothetical protein
LKLHVQSRITKGVSPRARGTTDRPSEVVVMSRGRLWVNRGRLFWSLGTLVFAVREVFVLRLVLRKVRPGHRVLVFLANRNATPRSLIVALVTASVATFLAELIVGLLLAPAVRMWLTPRTDSSDGAFRLSANERVLDSTPARRKMGRSWPAGTLVRTNLRLWFFPTAWDAEPWTVPIAGPEEVGLEPCAGFAWGLTGGVPDRVRVASGVDTAEVFAVADPATVLSWFGPSGAPSGSLARVSTST